MGEWRYISTYSLTSALDRGDQLHAPTSAPGIHWIRGWVDPRYGLDTVSKRKILGNCHVCCNLETAKQNPMSRVSLVALLFGYHSASMLIFGNNVSFPNWTSLSLV